MANEPMALPPGAFQALTRLEHDVRNLNVSTLTAALVTASGRPHSIAEVMKIQQSVYFSMYAGDVAANGAYQAWAKDKEKHINEPIK